MKQCPTCNVPLVTEAYEGENLWRCQRCHGAFVSKYKLEIMRHQRTREQNALQDEAKADFKSDTKSVIRCPRCRDIMGKRPISSRYTELTLDYCKSCEGIWLDGGELAIAQLVFEASTRGIESIEFQKRMQELEGSPERKAEFEEAMARLPEKPPGQVEEQLEGMLWRAIRRGIWYL